MKRVVPLLVLASSAVASSVAAQDVTVTAGGQNGNRYEMRSTADGTLRLDTRTGETTLCTTADGQLRCTVSAEERAAYEKEIDALGSRLEALEQRLMALESPEPLSGDERDQVDKAVGMAERAMRGFAGAVKRLKEDLGSN